MKPIASIDKCTTCSTCVTACPVTRVTRKFNGPKLTGPSSQRFRLLGGGEIEGLDYCNNCKNCDMACPCGVKISTLNMLARAAQCRENRPSLRDWGLAHGHILARLAAFVPQGLLRFGMSNSLARELLHLLGIDRRAPMPVFAPSSFRRLFARREAPSVAFRRVIFFPGCYINDYDPQTGLDVVWLLERAGYSVTVPSMRCCGVPLVANGYFDEARAAAAANCAELLELAHEGAPVVAACPSCALMLRREYGELFPDIPGLEELAGKVRDAGEFFAERRADGCFALPCADGAPSFVYHHPCHLRAQGIGRPSFALLKKAGIAVDDAGADCCGISGSYGFKREKYEVGAAIGAPLFETVKMSQAQTALSECGTCRLQISGHTGKKARHPLSVLRDLVEGRAL